MATIDEESYISVISGRKCRKNWWLIKADGSSLKSTTGKLVLNTITLPKQYVGKRVRLKVEIMK